MRPRVPLQESMSSLSVDVFTPLLISLLRQEHNPDMMLLASRALCHLMDAIPSSSAAIVHFDGVPLFCARPTPLQAHPALRRR